MPRITLSVIAASDGYTVLQKAPGDISPYQGRGGDLDLLCGECHHMLAEHVHPAGIPGIVLRCPICEACNLTGALEPGQMPPSATGWAAVQARDLRHP
jgi:hypothetical protein